MLFLSDGIESYITKQMYASNSPLVIEVYKNDSVAPNMSAPQTLIAAGEPFTGTEIEELSHVTNVIKAETGTTIPQSATYSINGKDEKLYYYQLFIQDILLH